MPKFVLLLTLLINVHSLTAQREINAVRSDSHLQIPGTKLLLIPPAGFEPATNFQGFVHYNSGSSILVVEVPAPYEKTSAGMDEKGLKSQGVIVKKKEQVLVNGLSGILLSTEQFARGTEFIKYILVFGDDEKTILINGIYPKEVPELDGDILAALFSVIYENELVVDPLSHVSFAVETANTKLKFAKNLSGVLLYTVDGKIPTESKDLTSFLVGISFSEVDLNDHKGASLERIKKLPYTITKMDEKNIREIEIDGISGYEIIAEGINKSKNPVVVYQVMLFTDGGYYLMVGTAETDFETNLALFRQVAGTFRRK